MKVYSISKMAFGGICLLIVLLPVSLHWRLLANGTRTEGKVGKVALVSVCGFAEIETFEPLIAHMKAICENMRTEFMGAIVRPSAPALPAFIETGLPVDDIFDAAKDAGRELARDGSMSEETLAKVSRELMPKEVFVEMANFSFHQQIDAHAKGQEQ